MMNKSILMIAVVFFIGISGCEKKDDENVVTNVQSSTKESENSKKDPCKEDPHSRDCLWDSEFEPSTGKKW